jgi:hypothetical protein
MAELKDILVFLGITNTSAFKIKGPSIIAVVEQYESLLLGYDIIELKAILSILEVDYKDKSKKHDLIKKIIGRGF